MKNILFKSALASILAGMLFTGTLLSAQSAQEPSLALPKTHKPNFTVQAGPMYTYADAKDGHLNLYGLNASFGWRIDKHNKLGVEIGFLYGYEEVDLYRNNRWYDVDIDYYAIPMLLSYSFYIPLDSEERWELCITPSAGFFYLAADWETGRRHYYSRHDDDDDDIAFTYGISATLTYHINKAFYVQAGYRYMKTSSMELSPPRWSGIPLIDLGKMNTHSITATFGWKF